MSTRLLRTHFYRPQRSCGQGNIFTPVCHSVHRGGLPQCMLGWHPPWSRPPRADTPQSRHPPEQTPPQSRHPLEQTPPGPDPPRPDPSQSRHHPPPQDQTPPPLDQTPPPPRKQTPAYGLRAAGTHPTGMHFCCMSNCSL